MTKIRFWLSSHVQVVVSVVGFTCSPHHGSPLYGLVSGSCARRLARMSESEPELAGTFQVSMPPLQSQVDPSGKTTSISCECGSCALAVVDTVATGLLAVGVVVLPHAVSTSATTLSAMPATTGLKRRAFTLATLGPSVAHRAGTACSLSSLGDLGGNFLAAPWRQFYCRAIFDFEPVDGVVVTGVAEAELISKCHSRQMLFPLWLAMQCWSQSQHQTKGASACC